MKTIQPQLKLKNTDFQALFTVDGLTALDQEFQRQLQNVNPVLAEQLQQYRAGKFAERKAISEWLIASAPILENFIAELFGIEKEAAQLKSQVHWHDPIFAFKDFYVQQAKRSAKLLTDLSQFDALNKWVFENVAARDDGAVAGASASFTVRSEIYPSMAFTSSKGSGSASDRAIISASDRVDIELAVACLGVKFLKNKEAHQHDIDKLIHWCVLVQQTDTGKEIIKNWRLFHLPKKKDYNHLVPITYIENDPFARFEGPHDSQRERDGFALTDERMTLRDVLDEIHYCVYCHKNEGDFCSTGFPVKKNNPELGLKINPVGDVLTGCPLEEKISEMHTVKKSGLGIAALAIVTIDNPMCAVTGHRICNDCMKACIYQKQDPVNIPEIETRVLTDVLALPWGVEIYDLFIRWNPLRQTQFIPKAYNHKNVLVMGMGPAGFTLAHHLLMEGCAVVGMDGLKIEPLPKHLILQPIYDFNAIKESLDDRIMAGFGGVAEYGITVRWDKNFLKLIYMHLSRMPYFQVFGDVRFGGTITIEAAWQLGFDHVAIAVGAGLPREMNIPNSLAPGMRQANDFLMALQLTGAIKKSSLANLQMRLPAVVIGGGLTGIDTATEAQAYYVLLVEKTHQRYHILKSTVGEETLRHHFDAQSLEILDEYLAHAEAILSEKNNARAENRVPQIKNLIRQWGGVTIAYRKSIQESPAYQRNHEEIIKALEEGIYYAEGLEPIAVVLDKYGAANALTCRWRIQDEAGNWMFSTEEQTLPAKSIFVATGAKPNIAYEFEHRGTFVRAASAYQCYNESNHPVETDMHVKAAHFGAFTSYDRDDHRVSFIGDTHPVFHGSVVKAIASAKRSYPKIIHAIKTTSREEYAVFSDKIADLFSARVVAVVRHTKNIVELTVRAPLAAKQFHPGQFYRIQNYETSASVIDGTKLQTEAISALGVLTNQLVPGKTSVPCLPLAEKGTEVLSGTELTTDQLTFFIIEKGASSKLVSTFQAGQPISIMGPTGTKAKIPKTPETILIVGNAMAIIYLLSVGPELKRAGCKIILVAAIDDQFALDRISAVADEVIFCEAENKIIDALSQINLSSCENIFVIGSSQLLKMMRKEARAPATAPSSRTTTFHPNAKFTASVYGPMQCMLKGVCAQCLQWQIDPATGQRTKAVYACSWQQQPIEMIDIDNITDRLGQNRMQETLTNLWTDNLLKKSRTSVIPQKN